MDTFYPKVYLKVKENACLRGDLICTYTLPEYIDIYVDGLCTI